MLLAIDIGNTMVTIGVFDGTKLVTTMRTASDSNRLPDEYGLLLTNLLKLKGIEPSQITAICTCSVVPPLTATFEVVSKNFFHKEQFTITSGVKTGLPILYDSPRDVGSDRIVDAVAGVELYGAPLIIVDFGTATVFDAISNKREYVGGAIVPGVNISAEALFLNTSQLRRVELVAPDNPIGKNTTTALQSGLVFGYTDLVTGLVSRFKNELGENAKVIGTGGLSPIIAKHTDIFDHINLDLTLLGLNILYAMNRPDYKKD
tara:strand:- start:150 stop:932 length:783 start_codon:yes stop_codon:yes gene_type:complete